MEPEQLYSDFRNRGVARGGELYLPVAAAPQFVERANEVDLAIIGVEAAVIVDRWTRSQGDLILDLSDIIQGEWERYRRECNEEVLQFLANLPPRPGLHVCFTLLKRHR